MADGGYRDRQPCSDATLGGAPAMRTRASVRASRATILCGALMVLLAARLTTRPPLTDTDQMLPLPIASAIVAPSPTTACDGFVECDHPLPAIRVPVPVEESAELPDTDWSTLARLER